MVGAPAGQRLLAIAKATLIGAGAHGVTIGAAGCAFFTALALFPAMDLLINLYGLLFNPRSIEFQLNSLSALLPQSTYVLIDRWVRHLVLHSSRTLTIGIALSTLITLMSAASGTRALVATLAATHPAPGQRKGVLRQNALALMMTMGAILVAILAIALLTLMPIAAAMLELRRPFGPFLHAAGTVFLIALGGMLLSLLYRVALPATGPKRHVIPGTVLATMLWLIASWLISFYADHLARFAATYGPVGAMVGLMLWLYATFYAALIGAELNAQLDRTQTDAAPVATLRVAE